MLINITGIDGCGKGTQVDSLHKYLEKLGYSVYISKAYGQAEKEIFSLYMEYADDLAIMFLFQSFHVHQRVETEKALKKGDIVIADRWDEAYLAYHSNKGFLMNNPELRDKLNEIAFGGIKPDISFLLDIAPEEGIRRCKIRGADFFDRKGIEYHTKLNVAYKKIAMENNEWVILDGSDSPIKIHKQIISHILNIIK